jgi:RNA recognition motif-containing protein
MEHGGGEDAYAAMRPSRFLHVGNLTRSTKAAHVREVAEQFAPVISVDLQRAPTGLSKGVAMLACANEGDAARVLVSLDGAQLDGAMLRVNFMLEPRHMRPEEPADARIPPPWGCGQLVNPFISERTE